MQSIKFYFVTLNVEENPRGGSSDLVSRVADVLSLIFLLRLLDVNITILGQVLIKWKTVVRPVNAGLWTSFHEALDFHRLTFDRDGLVGGTDDGRWGSVGGRVI